MSEERDTDKPVNSQDSPPTTSDPQAQNSPPANGAPRKRRLSKTLPTDRIPFKKQLEIISAIPVAFEKHGGPVSFKEVGSLLTLAEATLLQMSAFLTDVGLISRNEGGKFTPCPELLEHARIRSFSIDKAWLKLTPVFERSWYGQELIPRLKLREMAEADAIHALAEACGADISNQPQLENAVAFLAQSGVIVRDGGPLRLPLESATQAPAKIEQATPALPPQKPEDIEIEGLEKHSLTLDPKNGRKVVIFAPPTLRAKELERLQQWLGFQFIIDDDMTT